MLRRQHPGQAFHDRFMPAEALSWSSAIGFILVLCLLPVPRAALRRPLVCGDKRIAGAVFERGDLHLQGRIPRFPLEHLPNEVHDLGVASIAGQARRKPRQHRRGIAGQPIHEEQPAGSRRMRGIPVQASAEVMVHSDILLAHRRSLTGPRTRRRGRYSSIAVVLTPDEGVNAEA